VENKRVHQHVYGKKAGKKGVAERAPIQQRPFIKVDLRRNFGKSARRRKREETQKRKREIGLVSSSLLSCSSSSRGANGRGGTRSPKGRGGRVKKGGKLGGNAAKSYAWVRT